MFGKATRAPAARVLEVSQVWFGLTLRVVHIAEGGPPVRLGGLHPTFASPDTDLPRPGFALLRWEQGHCLLEVDPRWSGSIQRGEGLLPLGAMALEPGDRVRVETGHVRYEARLVDPARRVHSPLAERVDYPLLGVGAFSTFALTLLITAVGLAPPPTTDAVVELPDRITTVFMEVPTPELPEERSPEPAGEAAKEEAGRIGREDARMEVAKGLKTERQRNEDIVSSAGVLGMLAEGGGLDDVFGSSALSADLAGGIGGLLGAKGVQVGTRGFSSRGTSLGGGGSVAGLGGIDTHGHGGGHDDYGSEGGRFQKRGRGRAITDFTEPATVIGGMGRKAVDDVIKRHLSQIRYCYERELVRSPNMGGKVDIRFVIAGNGEVSKATVHRSSLGNSAVESCITRRFLHFRFPQVRGGGIVVVRYPFVFSPG